MKILTHIALSILVLVFIGAAAPPKEIIVKKTGEAAIAQPKIEFEIRTVETDRPLKPSRDDLGELLGVTPPGGKPLAFLDTGASSIVFSKATADRYGIARDPDARFIETGITGELAMRVSSRYTLRITDHPAAENKMSSNTRRGGRTDTSVELKEVRFLINDTVDQLTELLGVLGGAVDVIGMPAVKNAAIEIQPQRTQDTSVPVRMLRRYERPRADVWFQLEMIDYTNPKHTENRGPLPETASNPVVPQVVARDGTSEVKGDWLLDTGSAVTIISRGTATSIGLIDSDGEFTREPDFKLPLGGIAGKKHELPGFRIDEIRLVNERAESLRFHNPSIVVHDISVTRSTGQTETLAGVLGMNLLLQSGRGFSPTGFAETVPSAFDEIICDFRRHRIGFSMTDQRDGGR